MWEHFQKESNQKKESIICPFCGKGKIDIIHIPGYMSWKVNRISAGAKRTKYYHASKTEVQTRCPICKKSKKEIHDAITKGSSSSMSPEERVKRIREAGLPTTIE